MRNFLKYLTSVLQNFQGHKEQVTSFLIVRSLGLIQESKNNA